MIRKLKCFLSSVRPQRVIYLEIVHKKMIINKKLLTKAKTGKTHHYIAGYEMINWGLEQCQWTMNTED